jgi:hypothetical protein
MAVCRGVAAAATVAAEKLISPTNWERTGMDAQGGFAYCLSLSIVIIVSLATVERQQSCEEQPKSEFVFFLFLLDLLQSKLAFFLEHKISVH